jgi:phosphatidylglycerophosphatase A
VPVFWWLSSFSSSVYLLITLVLAGVGVWLCERAAKTLGVHDHSGIVWDEIVGLLLTLFLAPPGWAWLVTGFVLFRFFDIVKPWPISWLDRRVKGGLGIMLDDVVAALFAWLVLQLLAFWLLP